MSKMLAMAVPILPGKEAEWKKFSEGLKGSRNAEFKESRKKLNVRERSFYQHTPHGDFIIVTLEGDNPEQAFMDFAKGDDDFTKWFATGVKEVHGFDLTQPPQGPLPELIVDSGA